MVRSIISAAAACAFIAGCAAGEDSGPFGPDHEHPIITEARTSIPTALALHQTVIARSCSPRGGVCHSGLEYPDLHTIGNLIGALGLPCNLDKFDDPEAVFDGCEPDADVLVVSNGAWQSRFAWIGADEFDDATRSQFRRFKLENAAPRAFTEAPAKIMRGGAVFVDLASNVTIVAGQTEGRLVNISNIEYATYLTLATVRGGDLNGNRIFGGDQPWQLIAPGHRDRSYLIGRITGTVPGSRMPLANEPLSNAEYAAMICWIETLGPNPQADDAIDYDGCNFARNPVMYAPSR